MPMNDRSAKPTSIMARCRKKNLNPARQAPNKPQGCFRIATEMIQA